MSKIFVEIDYIAMAQWIEYGRHSNKPKNENVDEAFRRITNILDKAVDNIKGGVDGKDH